MKKKKKIPVIIVSADKEVIELAKNDCGLIVKGILDPNLTGKVLNIPVLGSDNEWGNLISKSAGLRVILPIDPPVLKEKLAYHYGINSLLTLISADAYISESATLKHGCVIQDGVKIMPSADIGIACKININAVVHHDSRVGDFCTLAPGSMLLGSVILENNVFIGAGAIVLPKVRIGRNSVVGAGAVVARDVAPGSVVAGVPARQIVKES